MSDKVVMCSARKCKPAAATRDKVKEVRPAQTINYPTSAGRAPPSETLAALHSCGFVACTVAYDCQSEAYES